MSWEHLRRDHFTSALSTDVAAMVIGRHIADGQFRSVFEWLGRRSTVAKLENGAQSFHNITEHAVWNVVKDTAMAKWFAPVIDISSCGIVLLQERTKPIKESERHLLPKRVPRFLADIKPTNWGWLRGRIVCHDYANNYIIENGLVSGMRKADW